MLRESSTTSLIETYIRETYIRETDIRETHIHLSSVFLGREKEQRLKITFSVEHRKDLCQKG